MARGPARRTCKGPRRSSDVSQRVAVCGRGVNCLLPLMDTFLLGEATALGLETKDEGGGSFE